MIDDASAQAEAHQCDRSLPLLSAQEQLRQVSADFLRTPNANRPRIVDHTA